MTTEVPDPEDVAAYDARAALAIGGPRPPLTGPIRLVPYDAEWPVLYAREAELIRRALGDGVVRLEHVGSTSIPGLAAKPVIDIALEVPDSTDEPAYVPQLEAVGFVLRFREPEWFEHRVFKRERPSVNLHTFSAGCEEIDQMLRFRNWLRGNAADRELYERTKRELAAREWKYMQQYADAKTEVVREILARAARSTR